MSMVQVPMQQQRKTYDGLEISVVRLDEDHILLAAPGMQEIKRHIVHSVDEATEIFRSYLKKLMAQAKDVEEETAGSISPKKNLGDN